MSYLDEIKRLKESDREFIWHPFTQMKGWIEEGPIIRELKTFFHGHSYTGNPLACAAALASLQVFEKEHTLEKAGDKIALLESKLSDIAELSHVGNVRNKGLMAGIELVTDKSSKGPYSWEERMGWKVAYKARDEGVLIRPLGNVVVIMPPISISVESLERLMDVVKKSIIAVT